jgi:hypothetical protein
MSITTKPKIILNKNKTFILELKRELFSLLQKYRIPNKNIVYSKNNDFENIQYFCREIQDALFDLYGQETTSQLPSEKIYEDYKYIPRCNLKYKFSRSVSLYL